MAYIAKLKSGKVYAYLRPFQTITGYFGIETRLVKQTRFTPNINLPLFNSLKEAETYLSANYFEDENHENKLCT